jgi:tripartite-type tricarboxylate transporter receptor subunit TctC
VQPLLRKRPAYDPLRDLSPITMAVSSPNILVVDASVPANSVQELIALARSKPGVLNYGSPGTGASAHLAAELFNARAGVQIVRVVYRGTGPATNALVSGEVQMMFGTASSVGPHIKSGRLRALAVSSAEPTALAPGLPTVATTLPGYESTAKWGLFAPAKTPAALIDWLNKKLVEVLNTPDAKQKFFSSGAEVIASSPEWCLAKIKSEIATMGKVIKDAGIGEE